MSKFGLELSYLFEHRIPGAKDIDERFSMHITQQTFAIVSGQLFLRFSKCFSRPNHHDGWEWQVPEVPSSEFLVRQMPPVLLYPMTKIDPSLAERVEVLRSVQNLESTGAQNHIAWMGYDVIQY